MERVIVKKLIIHIFFLTGLVIVNLLLAKYINETRIKQILRPAQKQDYHLKTVTQSKKYCCNGLIYSNTNSWVVWINSTIITPQRPHKQLKIQSINNNAVTCQNTQNKLIFTLKHKQCYDCNTKKIYYSYK